MCENVFTVPWIGQEKCKMVINSLHNQGGGERFQYVSRFLLP